MENRIDIAAFSDTGTELGHNEDHCGKLQLDGARGVVVVADGMAPFEGGDLASRRAILGFLREFREQPGDRSLANRMLRAARGANFEVYDMAVVVPQLRGMSTTLTAVAVEAGLVACAHVGNGRVYRLRGGALEQLSKDHTVLAESPNPLSFAGPGSRVFRDDHLLTRSLGRELIVTVDLFETELAPGETLIVCTDGL
jgi:protein phosphatase